jgi:hypothetical protein
MKFSNDQVIEAGQFKVAAVEYAALYNTGFSPVIRQEKCPTLRVHIILASKIQPAFCFSTSNPVVYL